MDTWAFILQNKEIIKIFYGLLITLACFFIVLKTHRLFRISLHQGIRYFRNAFLFYGLAFFTRYLIGSPFIHQYSQIQLGFFITFVFEFFLIMAGFFLLYSLSWKKFESPERNHISSLLNPIILIFYLMSILLALMDFFWRNYYFMFASQILIFLILSIFSYKNYIQDRKKARFLKFYFLAMFLTFITWILNATASLLFEWNKAIVANVYIVNLIVFLLFLYGVIKVTRK